MSKSKALDPTLALLQDPSVRSAPQGEYLRLPHDLDRGTELELKNDALRLAQQELEGARARYFELYELSPVGYATLDENGRILGANLMLATLTGVERVRLVGSLFADQVMPQDHARFTAFVWRALQKAPAKQSIDVSLRNGTNSRPVMLEAGTGEAPGDDSQKPEARAPRPLRVAVIDLTTLKRTEEQVRDRELHLRAVLDTVVDGILTVAPNGAIEGANPAAGLLFQASLDGLCGRAINTLLPGVGGLVGQGRVELQATRPDGSTFPAEASVNQLVGQDGTRIVVVVSDVSERKQRQRALEEALTHFRQFAEHVDDAIFVVDAETGRTLYASPAFQKITGRPVPALREELLSLDWIHESDRERVAAAVRALRDGTPFDLQYRLCRPDGSVRTVCGRAFPIPEHRRITGILHDMTDELALQAELRQAQRLEAVGTLASGIAHDFNNLLMGVGGCLQLALRRIPAEHEAHAYLRRAADAILRGANLTRQILRFSDTRNDAEATVELDAALTGSRDLIQSLVGEQVALRILTGAPGLAVAADPGDIEQVLLNLASNARDAMPGGGALTLETKPLQGGRVALIARDAGVGMTEETKRRVFEPFYTTKAVGKGTGLGLSTVFAVVRRIGGAISIDSAIGRGTTFTLDLPVVIAEPVSCLADADAAPRGDGQTILVVDDDPLIRLTVETHVESLGYRALTAASVPDALKLYTESPRLIDVVLTDVMMPGLLGSDLGRILEKSAPGIAVVYMSAHPQRELVLQGHVKKNSHWLGKPFDTRELGAALHRALSDRVSQPSVPARVFVVDDDRDGLDALREFLEIEGHTVGVATTSLDALRDVPAFAPDIVLSDISIDEAMTGFELVTRLRTDERLRNTVFLAVTGTSKHQIEGAAADAGFRDVLTKPLGFQHLSRVLASYLRR